MFRSTHSVPISSSSLLADFRNGAPQSVKLDHINNLETPDENRSADFCSRHFDFNF
jgi:hypothetical protein